MKITFISGKKVIVSFLLIVTIVLSSVFLNVSGAYAVFYGKPMRKLPVYSVDRADKKIAISFDCAWGVDYTDKLLEIMKAENVTCTFFTVEFWAEKHPEYLKKISDAEHEIGTHSSTHPYMSKLDKNAIVSELTTSIEAIERVTDKKVTLFRAPYGDYDDLLIDTATSMGLYTIQWSIDSLDWKNLSANEITSRVLKRAHSGAIVLFHNQGLHTAEALPTIINSLKQEGYEFVPIGRLIYTDNYFIDANGCQKRSS